MHIKANMLFTIQSKSLDVPEVSGFISKCEQLKSASDKARLVIYRDNVPVVILETYIAKIKRYLQTEFNFSIYSLTEIQ